MADNTTLNAGAGGDVIATDDIGGIKFQRVKLTWGADGVAGDVTAANPVPVSDAGGSLTVDGTVAVSGTVTVAAHAVTNAGTFVVQENGAALTALQLIDNVVFVEDVASAGAESGVPALAVRRDTPSSGVSADGDWANLSVDSTGALRVTGAGTQFAEDATHTSGDTGTMALVVRRDANTTMVSADGDYSPLQVDAVGALKVNIIAGAGSGGASATDDAAFTVAVGAGTPMMGVVTADTVDAGDVGVVGMTAARELKVSVTSGGITGRAEDSATAGGEDGVPILVVRRDAASSGVSTDGDWANLSCDSNGALRVSGAAGTTQYTEDTASAGAESLCLAGAVRRDTAASSGGTDGDYVTLNTDATGKLWVNASGAAVPVTDNAGSLTVDNGGTFAVQSAQSGTWTVQPGNTPNTSAWLTSNRPATSGGLTTYHLVSAGSANPVNVKASAGQLYGWYIYNTNAAARKVAFHNTAGTPTAGASVFFSMMIPPGGGANVMSETGIAFGTGIGITTVVEGADSGTTAVAAGDLIINLWYA